MIFFEVAWPALVPHNLTVGASTGGQLAQDPGRTYAYWRATRQRPRPHLRQNMRRGKHTVRAALFSDQTSTTTPAAKGIQVLQAPLRKSIRRAESAEKALQLSRDQIRQLRDQKTAQLPVEVDLHACSVQHGVDPTAPQATQKPVARRRPMITHIGPDHKQPPPRSAKSTFRSGLQGCRVVSFPHRWRTPSTNRGDQVSRSPSGSPEKAETQADCTSIRRRDRW